MTTGEIRWCEEKTNHSRVPGHNQCYCGFRDYPCEECGEREYHAKTCSHHSDYLKLHAADSQLNHDDLTEDGER